MPARTRSRRWKLYILRCADGTLYTGVTNDLERRVAQHAGGTASRYTRTRLPVTLLYAEGCLNRSSALRKELRVKALTRPEKEAYIVVNTGHQTPRPPLSLPGERTKVRRGRRCT